ncbi:hypothetical protein RHSIM_Rhsim11G0181100 [Rhododendron simsii]|uniref:Beta-galactosidase n=1 Tax=Rhododendron simsii TaxID=118357 RepID=A0A834G7X1_RHOSS|nr:hypothetical protein RHSIM_Rhsim11G0181100 [Rhododendron simsii]
MEANSASKWCLLCLFLIWEVQLTQCSVTYDNKALIINGQKRILFSGSIHYPRSTPQMWEGLIQKAKDGGLDVIDTYVFWNLHEPSAGNIAMQGFTQKIVQMMKDEKLFQSQGGPVILSQIENEYGPQSTNAGRAYMRWAVEMAVELGTGVPWVMCKQDDAPDPVINTCNGFYCDYFSPNKPYKPAMWTEAWTGWFTEFGGPIQQRPVEDLAFAVARFIQKGGSFVNYYMYQGGTNFGRTAGGPFITTSYDYDAPIDEYGLIRQPKYGHLKELHRAIKLCERALVSAEPTVTMLGNYEQAFEQLVIILLALAYQKTLFLELVLKLALLSIFYSVIKPFMLHFCDQIDWDINIFQAHVFSSKSGDCAAFLSNYHMQTAARVRFNNMYYDLPPWSISILPNCKNVVFNTAKVGVQTSKTQMLPTNAKLLSWETFSEDLSSANDDMEFRTVGLLEQLNVTRDISDYLWYSTSVDISPSESFLRQGQHITLTVQSAGDALHVFANGHLSGSAFGSRESRKFTFTGKVNLHAGRNTISLLSVAVGLPNNGAHFETWNTGVQGPVVLHGLDKGKRDLSWQKWSYKVGLRGERMNLVSSIGVSFAGWMPESLFARSPQPLTWYKAYFNAPDAEEPLALDMGSMGKGQVWINGQNIGRYWTLSANGNCTQCIYSGTFRPKKCQLGCGQPTQRWYHVPRSWLKPTHNQLVVFEELHGDVSRIALVKRSVTYS